MEGALSLYFMYYSLSLLLSLSICPLYSFSGTFPLGVGALL